MFKTGLWWTAIRNGVFCACWWLNRAISTVKQQRQAQQAPRQHKKDDTVFSIPLLSFPLLLVLGSSVISSPRAADASTGRAAAIRVEETNRTNKWYICNTLEWQKYPVFSSVTWTNDTNKVGLLCCFAFFMMQQQQTAESRMAKSTNQEQPTQKVGKNWRAGSCLALRTVFAMRGKLPCARAKQLMGWLLFGTTIFAMWGELPYVRARQPNLLLTPSAKISWRFAHYVHACNANKPMLLVRTGSYVQWIEEGPMSSKLMHFWLAGWLAACVCVCACVLACLRYPLICAHYKLMHFWLLHACLALKQRLHSNNVAANRILPAKEGVTNQTLPSHA